MQFLSSKSVHLYQDLLPEMGSIITSRIINYLSFYNSFNGGHQYYTPYLYSHEHLQRYFSKTSLEGIAKTNYEHLLTKVLISMNYHEHVMDARGTYRFISDLYQLTEIEKKDIVQSFLKIKCKAIYANQAIQVVGKLLPPEKRRNVYVEHARILPKVEELAQIVTLNPFYRLPNINKILVFTNDPNQKLQLTKDLESFCHENSVKIKLFDSDKTRSSLESLVEYLYTKNKNKILIHENINFEKSAYDLETPLEKQKTVKNKVINKLNTRLMPQEVILLTQRLPFQSQATKDSKNEILQKMRELLNLEKSQDLIDPINRLAMSTIQQLRQIRCEVGNLNSTQKNYKHEDESDHQQSKFGFLLSRFVTEQLYNFNRKYRSLQKDQKQIPPSQIPAILDLHAQKASSSSA